MNPANPPFAPRKLVWKLRHVPLAAVNATNATATMIDDFQQRENHLEVTRALDADVVQPGNQRGSSDGDQLSIADGEGRAHRVMIEEREERETFRGYARILR